MIPPNEKDWNKFWNSYQNFDSSSISWSKRRIIGVLRNHLVADKKILDAGCGSGFFSKYFCDQGMVTYSVDYSMKAINLTKDLTQARSYAFKLDLLEESLGQLLNEKFDFIFSDGLLEHFEKSHQDKIMQNFKGVLNEKGMIMTFVPNRYSPWQWIRPIFMPGIEEKPFRLDELIDLNLRNDMRIIENGGINVIPLALSPERKLGKKWGMLLFAISNSNNSR